MVSQDGPYILGPSPLGDPSLFKKHKVLPHPKRNRVPRSHESVPVRYPLEQHFSSGSGSSSSSERSISQSIRVPSLRHRSKRIGSGPEMPPTPPTHSRSSSSTQSIFPSSPTCVDSPGQSSENVTTPERPSTPPNQQSPPTPDVTPPGPAAVRPPARPVFSHRLRTRTGETLRTESYKTAPEYPASEDEKSERSTLRPQPPSSKTSQNTVRRVAEAEDDDKLKTPKPVGLGLGLESSPDDEEKHATPKANGDQFEPLDVGSGSSRTDPGWDSPVDEAKPTKKAQLAIAPLTPSDLKGGRTKVVEENAITPTTATKALRSMSLHERSLTEPSPNPNKDAADEADFWTMPQTSNDNDADDRRASIMSTKSTVSTIVEAILVDASPQRQKTLRHVRKATALRDSTSDVVPTSPRNSIRTQSAGDRGSPKRAPRPSRDRRHDSVTSNGTTSSISSNKARRDIWRRGGVPVVVVPERRSSVQTSGPHSLRSTSSRRSKRSNSVGSVPLSSISPSKDLSPYFERPSRRRRATISDSGSLDSQRTIDYPPVVPVRTSSLSAPTSRNGSRNTSRNTSRAGSLTAESLQARDALQESLARKQQPAKNDTEQPTPEVKLERAATITPEEPTSPPVENSHHDENHHLNVDTNGDPFFGRRHSIHKTPFSQASVDTNGTSAAEVSEAMAVNIYPHQNSSVLMVDHSGRPSDSSDEPTKVKQNVIPKVVATYPDAEMPVTPPQARFHMEDVDSPLRNPRAPPEPPVLHEPPALSFIPATPSGMTPAAEKEKMLGNFYEEVYGKPRRPSLVRRTFSRHRYTDDRRRRLSDDGQGSLLKRTLTLSRNIRLATNEKVATLSDKGKEPAEACDYPTGERTPPDETKLHPFWRPQYSESDEEDEDWDPDMDDEHDGHYRYPAIDNRPPHPRRSLTSRLKRTFAILPLQMDDEYPVSSSRHSTRDNRTIKRTASGNLRVLKNRRISLESFHRAHGIGASNEERPYTAPDRSATSPAAIQSLRHKPRFLSGAMQHRGNGIAKPRSPSPRRKPKRSNSRLRDILNDYGLHTLPRRFSERRREKRSRELRSKISGPREVRDGVGEIIRRGNLRDGFSAEPRV